MGIVSFLVIVPFILYPFKLKPEEEGILPYGGKHNSVQNKMKSNFNVFTWAFIAFMIAASLIYSTTSITSYFPDYVVSIGLGAMFGSIYGVVSVGTALLCKDFFGKENYAIAFPKVTFCTGIVTALSASLIGYMYDFTKTYSVVFIIYLFILLSIFVLE